MPAPRDHLELRPGRFLLSVTGRLGILAALFWHFVVVQFQFALHRPGEWGHTLLVPIATGFLVWIDRERLFARPFRVSGSGYLLVGLGLGLYGLTLLGPGWLQVHNARSLGIAVILCGCVITILGWGSLRVLWFPLLYLFLFGQFVSPVVLAPITDRLQDLAASGARFTLGLFGYDTIRSGNLLMIETPDRSRPIDVAEACSGMRMLMAFLALGTLIAWSGLPLLWQRGVLVLLAVPIALLVNIVRIAMQGVLDTYDPELTTGAAHSFISMLWLIPALLLFLLCQWFLSGFSPEESSDSEPVRSVPRWSTRTPIAFGVRMGLLIFGGVMIHFIAGWAGVHSIKQAVPLRAPLETVSTVLGPWKRVGTDLVYPDTVVDVLGTSAYLDRTYRLDGEGQLQLHVAHYTGGPTTRPHLPERCWSVTGLIQTGDASVIDVSEFLDSMPESDRRHRSTGESYRAVDVLDLPTGEPRRLHVPVGNLELRVSIFADPLDPGVRLVGGYFFIANGRLTSSAYGVRALAYQPGDRHAFFTKIQFTQAIDAAGLSDEDVLASYERLVESILPRLLPELLRVLPDWSDLEADP
ncbi:MAG: exosortase/archaeosortase family protein [Planctomycetota bacterium]|nr:exosortase/archaeosortase family protein [Planctomycetota bacterium]